VVKQVFKIRNSQGLFSSGGTYITFTKKGKTWTSSGALNNHLAQTRNDNLYIQEKCEVIAYELVETEVSVESVQSRLKLIQDRARLRNEEKRQLLRSILIEHDLIELDRLKKLYE